MPEGLLREIRKLEVRLENFLKEESSFVKELKEFLQRLKEFNEKVKAAETVEDPRVMEELMSVRLGVIRAFSEAVKREGEVEHEKSHLLESYGDVLSALDVEFNNLLEQFIKSRSD